MKFALRFYLRSYRFLTILIIAVFVLAVIVAAILYFGTATLRQTPVTVALGLPIGLAYFIILIGAALLGGDATSIDTGTASGYYTLVLPVRRSVLLLGRFVAASAVTFIAILVLYVGAGVLALSIWGVVPPGLFTSLGAAVLTIAAFMGLAFTLSTLARRPTYGIVLTFCIIVFGVIIIGGIASGFGITPWFLVTYGAGIVPLLLQGSTWPADGSPTLAQGVAILSAYFAGGLLIALAVFDHQEVR